jgi:phospholipid transport system substrate-binding protein
MFKIERLARRRALRLGAALLVLAWAGPLSAGSATDDAGAFMAQLADQAIVALRSTDMTPDQREAEFSRLLDQALDIEAIGRFVAGRHFQKMSPQQRVEYQRLFSMFVVRSFARRLGDYSGETFSVISARAVDEQHVVVRSRIVRPSGPPIELDWRLRNGANAFRIVDVVVGGVSMSVTQQQDFSAVIARSGVDGLISALRLRTEPATAAAAAAAN